MIKIYVASSFLEADEVVSLLEEHNIAVFKEQVSRSNIQATVSKVYFEIYVDEKDVKSACKLVKSFKKSDVDNIIDIKKIALRIYVFTIFIFVLITLGVKIFNYLLR